MPLPEIVPNEEDLKDEVALLNSIIERREEEIRKLLEAILYWRQRAKMLEQALKDQRKEVPCSTTAEPPAHSVKPSS